MDVRHYTRLKPRRAPLRRLPCLGLTGLALFVAARGILKPDFDALVIASLMALLAWLLAVNQAHHDAISRKLDQLIMTQRYGSLTAEDREVVAALRAGRVRWQARPKG